MIILKKVYKDIRREIERYFVRVKYRKAAKNDSDLMAKAIIKANLISNKTKQPLWVVKLAVGEYAVFNKPQVKAFFRRLGVNVNFYQVNEYVIHIAKP